MARCLAFSTIPPPKRLDKAPQTSDRSNHKKSLALSGGAAAVGLIFSEKKMSNKNQSFSFSTNPNKTRVRNTHRKKKGRPFLLLDGVPAD